MLSSDYYVLRSTVIALNNFIQHSHCQVVQPFRSPFLIKPLTTIISKPPFLSFSCWNKFFCDCKCKVYRWTKEIFTKFTLFIGWLWFTLLAVLTDNLSSKLPTQTHQLHYPASKTSFSDTITSCRKTAVVLKLSNLTFAEFFTSTAKV